MYGTQLSEQDVVDHVGQYLTRLEAQICWKRNAVRTKQRDFGINEVARSVHNAFPAVSITRAATTLDQLVDRARFEAKQALHRKLDEDYAARDDLTRKAQCYEETDRFVRLVLPEDASGDDVRLARYAILQQLWHIKRRILALPSAWQIMLVLTGPQGTGKTTAVHSLTAFVGDFRVLSASCDIFKDDKRLSIFEDNYVVFFDEMDHVNKVGATAFKRLITTGETQARGLYEMKERHFINNAALFAASNNSLAEQIKDDQMRRFVEIRCHDKEVTADWIKQMRSIDVYRMLGGVNAADEFSSPAFEHRDLFRQHQTRVSSLNDFDYWADMKVIEQPDGPPIPNRILYADYRDFCRGQDHRPMSIQDFVRRMAGRFSKAIQSRVHNAIHFSGLSIRAEDGAG